MLLVGHLMSRVVRMELDCVCSPSLPNVTCLAEYNLQERLPKETYFKMHHVTSSSLQS